MPEHEAKVTVRPMTEEEIRKYGAPVRQTCAVCGRELMLCQFEFIVPGVEREQMVLGNSCRNRRTVCKECEKKKARGRRGKAGANAGDGHRRGGDTNASN